MSDQHPAPYHRGSDHASPYPVSRLAPAFHAPDLAAEVGRAEAMLGARTGAKLRVIADQIKALQAEARKVLAEAREEHALTHAQCAFTRRPGQVYHLYRRDDGSRYFSMLSPHDWRDAPPHPFVGSYRLEPDWSWTPAERLGEHDDTGELVKQLLTIGGLTPVAAPPASSMGPAGAAWAPAPGPALAGRPDGPSDSAPPPPGDAQA